MLSMVPFNRNLAQTRIRVPIIVIIIFCVTDKVMPWDAFNVQHLNYICVHQLKRIHNNNLKRIRGSGRFLSISNSINSNNTPA